MCVFCRIVKGELDAYKIYETKNLLVIMDKYPVSKGHLLVITKQHYDSVSDTPPSIVGEAFMVAGGLARFYKRKAKAPGVNIVANDGAVAGQEIFHFHVHVIPRWAYSRGIFAGRTTLTEELAKETYSLLQGVQEYLDNYLGMNDISPSSK
jgi:histidine triad (HIT) family protein